MKKVVNTTIRLFFVLVLCAGLTPALAETPTPTAQSAAPSTEAVLCEAGIFAALPSGEEALPAGLFGSEPLFVQDGPPDTCQVTCVDEPCTNSSECTSQPNGRCNIVCPGKGCCVYP